MAKQIEKTCEYNPCGKKFFAQRSDARFCSSNCRAQSSLMDRVSEVIIKKTETEMEAMYEAKRIQLDKKFEMASDLSNGDINLYHKLIRTPYNNLKKMFDNRISNG